MKKIGMNNPAKSGANILNGLRGMKKRVSLIRSRLRELVKDKRETHNFSFLSRVKSQNFSGVPLLRAERGSRIEHASSRGAGGRRKNLGVYRKYESWNS